MTAILSANIAQSGNTSSGLGETDTYGSGNTSSGLGNDSYGVSDVAFKQVPLTNNNKSGNTGSGGYGDKTDSYESGQTGSGGFGSGNTASTDYGADNTGSNYGSSGAGSHHQDNKSGKSGDSTAGKLLEKAGGLFKNEGMVEKGREKRSQAGNDEFSSGGNNNNDY